MKSRVLQVAGIFAAGVMCFSVPGIDVAASTLNAGVTATITSNIEGDSTVNAGVSSLISTYIDTSAEEAAAAKASIMENEAAKTTASQAEAEKICGYLNLGIARVEGNLNVRENPDEGAELVGKMPGDAGCEILEDAGDWTKIKSGEVTGYVKTEFLMTGDEARAHAQQIKTTMAKSTTQTLHVREQPNTDCKIVALMAEGEEVEVTENQGEWAKVNVDDEEGYVNTGYVEMSEELPKAMTLTEIKYGQGVSNVRVDLVSYACQFVGNPYVWGGTSLTNGADCSGFTLSIFAKYGVYLPHSSRAQANCGTRINASEAQPGDLFFYGSGNSISHVAIYIGNGQIVHASSRRTGIKISNAYYRSPICVTRVLS